MTAEAHTALCCTEGALPSHFGLRRRCRERLRSPFLGSMGIMTVSMAVSLLLQMLTFAIVAGTMGPRQFGAFATVAALTVITGSFSGWGAEQLLLRRVGRTPAELPRAMATGLVFLALSAPPLVLLSMALVPLAIDSSISWQVVLFVAISDIAFARVNSIAASCYQAVGRPRGNAWLSIGFGSSRLLAALLWIVTARSHDAHSWASYYLAVSVLGASLSLWRIRRDLGRPEWKIAWHEWRDGFHFALQTASYTAFGMHRQAGDRRAVELVDRRNLMLAANQPGHGRGHSGCRSLLVFCLVSVSSSLAYVVVREAAHDWPCASCLWASGWARWGPSRRW